MAEMQQQPKVTTEETHDGEETHDSSHSLNSGEGGRECTTETASTEMHPPKAAQHESSHSSASRQPGEITRKNLKGKHALADS